MSGDTVLRLRRTDIVGEHILVNLSKNGSKPLDLELVASEGDHVYPGSIHASSVKTLQDSKYSGSLEDWKTTLRFALLREQPTPPLPDMLQGVETVCAISGTTLIITIRKNIGGIHQRLGSVKLYQNDETEISPFDWAMTSAAKYDHLLERMDEMQVSATKHQDEVAKLNNQLDDLIQAKKDHEADILKKCAALLNAKKLKIRDQQRLLAGAKVDTKDAEEVKQARRGEGSSTTTRTAKTSRSGKRKANGRAEIEEKAAEVASANGGSGSEEDEQGTTAELEREQHTPDPTDDETADEDDVEEFDAAPPKRPLRSSQQTPASKQPANDKMDVDPDTPPPRRELPFVKKNAAAASSSSQSKSTSAPKAVSDPDETDEEEL